MVPRCKKTYSNRISVESNRSGTDLELATGGDQPRITGRQAAKTTLDDLAGMQVRAAGPEEVEMKLPVTLRDETMMIQRSVENHAAST